MAIPVITSATTAAAIRGTFFTYSTTASNTPTSFAATFTPGLAGVSINPATGVISGIPIGLAGTYSVSLTATNGSGTSTPVVLVITLAAATGNWVPGVYGWDENVYLANILCALRGLGGGASGGGTGGVAVPGDTSGAGATPVVIPAGMYSVSINVTAGTIVLSGASTEFTGTTLGTGSYNFAAPTAGYTLPQITVTGNGAAAYAITWMHI